MRNDTQITSPVCWLPKITPRAGKKLCHILLDARFLVIFWFRLQLCGFFPMHFWGSFFFWLRICLQLSFFESTMGTFCHVHAPEVRAAAVNCHIFLQKRFRAKEVKWMKCEANEMHSTNVTAKKLSSLLAYENRNCQTSSEKVFSLHVGNETRSSSETLLVRRAPPPA